MAVTLLLAFSLLLVLVRLLLYPSRPLLSDRRIAPVPPRSDPFYLSARSTATECIPRSDPFVPWSNDSLSPPPPLIRSNPWRCGRRCRPATVVSTLNEPRSGPLTRRPVIPR